MLIPFSLQIWQGFACGVKPNFAVVKGEVGAGQRSIRVDTEGKDGDSNQ